MESFRRKRPVFADRAAARLSCRAVCRLVAIAVGLFAPCAAISQPAFACQNDHIGPAHRLTAINDHKGNRIDYTLDAMGNRTAEQLRNPGGTLVKNIARVIDALNRVERLTGVDR